MCARVTLERPQPIHAPPLTDLLSCLLTYLLFPAPVTWRHLLRSQPSDSSVDSSSHGKTWPA